MIYKIVIDEEAIADIQETAVWYDDAQKGLGKRFKTQVKNQINGLKNAPFIGSFKTETTRGLLVKKFPFIIYYVVDKTTAIIEIHAVLHTSRNPKIWQSRVR
ncbi:MAG: type II toxin-antitoxin system RelE/ParE family toxin [Flavobacteriaceae bacterium]|jgi:plasmid stabilization system protein ParE|nr:type II toxin-antitoxin system RelE/ParE family toxin [Flavobacteriaceae bacterium]